MKLFVVRHAATKSGEAGKILGRIDEELSTVGKAAAKKFAATFATQNFFGHYLFCSPLQRAKQTAAIIAAALPTHPQLIIDSRLQERDFGELQGLTWPEFCQKFPELSKLNQETFQANLPHGESIAAVEDRVRDFLSELQLNYHDASQILIVTHSGIMRVIKRQLLAISATASRAKEIKNLELETYEL